MKLIEVKNLTVEYEHTKALENVSFTLESGDSLAVVGENGSGKSTLIGCILGLKKPTSGEIIFDSLTSGDIGYLPQTNALRDDFPASVREVVISGCRGKGVFGFHGAADKRVCAEKLELLGITPIAKRSYRELSGGQRQRALLARALCSAKKLLVLDEPVTGLDPMVTDDFYRVIGELNRGGMTVLTVSHDIAASCRISTKILHLGQIRGGKTVRFFGGVSEYMETELYRAMAGGRDA